MGTGRELADQSRDFIELKYVLAISAASFIYIATDDLVPGLHRCAGAKAVASQTLLILAGIGTIIFFRFEH